MESAYMIPNAERIARVEEQVVELKHKVDKMDEKLDQLLILRYKGAGAFWLASALVGTGIVGFITQVFHFFGGR